MSEIVFRRNIRGYFYQLSDKIAKNVAIGLTDENKFAEDLVAEILNEIFGYKLSNANEQVVNHPGIDLLDTENDIAVQVTSTNTPEKIRHTFRIIVAKKYYNFIDRVIFFFLKNESFVTSKTILRNIDNSTSGYIDFNVETDIFNNVSINDSIDKISDLEKLKIIEEILAEWLSLPGGGKMDPIRGYILPKRLVKYAGYSINELVGRNDTLNTIHEYFQSKEIVLITGLGGIGKTTVARAYIEKYKEQYDHLVYVDVSANLIESLIQNLSTIDKSFSINYEISPLQNLEYLFELLRTIYNTVLVIDNCDNEDELRKLKPLFESLEWKILVTSRTRPESYKDQTIAINQLEPSEALQLFTNFYEVNDEADIDIINQIISKAHYHTKLIILLAKAASQNPLLSLNTLIDKVDANAYHEEIIDIDVELNKEEKSVYQYILALFEPNNLDAYQKRYIRFFSVLPAQEIPANHLFELFELEQNQGYFINTLNRLAKKGWIEKYSNDYFRIHPLIQLVTQRKLQPTPDDCSILINNLMRVIDKSVDALSLSSYLPYCESIVAYFSNNPYQDIALMLNKMSHIYGTSAQYTKSLKANLSALEILNVDGLSFPEAEAQSYGDLMKTHTQIGNLNEAIKYGELALKIQENILHPMHPDLAATYSDLSNTLRRNNRSNLAHKYVTKAILIQKWLYHNQYTEKDAFNLIMSYKSLAALMADFGNQASNRRIIERALFVGYRALIIAKRCLQVNHYLFGGIYNDISLTLRDLDCITKSIYYLEKAIEVNKMLLPYNHPELALNYYNMGIIYKRKGEIQTAISYTERAYSIQEDIFPSNHTSVLATKKLLSKLRVAL